MRTMSETEQSVILVEPALHPDRESSAGRRAASRVLASRATAGIVAARFPKNRILYEAGKGIHYIQREQPTCYRRRY